MNKSLNRLRSILNIAIINSNCNRYVFTNRCLTKESKTQTKSQVKQLDNDNLFKQIKIKSIFGTKNVTNNENVGEQLSGPLKKDHIYKVLLDFSKKDSVKRLVEEVGLTEKIFNDGFDAFRKYCIQSITLPTELHIKFVDVSLGKSDSSDIFPYFYQHVKEIYPHIVYMDDLKKLSDLSEPSNWYPDARKLKRTIYYHCGPTNSGKTYSAMQRFRESKCGVYCAPLKLLANEIALRTNEIDQDICDLITGDDKRFVKEDGTESSHTACTIEMTNINKHYDVAVIDEIQMIQDYQRGWAWTRALLGLCADEIHVCGDDSVLKLLTDLCEITKDNLIVKEYKRLTNLVYLEKPLMDLSNVKKGDCFVCFSKADIFQLANSLKEQGLECAIIYGSMPPGVKVEQAKRFNNPADPCKIMVSTDAIGMGLNFNIKRIIFYSLIKPMYVNENETKMDYITVSQALQISGRAGRFNSPYKTGEVTTFKQDDLVQLHRIIREPLLKVTQAGLHPTWEQIELFSFHLPNYTFTNLLEIFMSLCKLDDSKYFMCVIEDMKYLAQLIDHIQNIPLRARYTFVSSPINRKNTFLCSVFVRFARNYSSNEPITVANICKIIDWPPKKLANNLTELNNLESMFDILDLYLWLGYRFPEIFVHPEDIKAMRIDLENFILESIKQLIKFQSNSISSKSTSKLLSKISKRIDYNESDLIIKKLKDDGVVNEKQLDDIRKQLNLSKHKENKEKY